MNRLELGIYSGRIVAAGRRARRRLESKRQSGDRRERLFIDMSRSGPRLSYEMATDDWSIGIEIIQGNQLTVRRHARGGSAGDVEYRQNTNGPVSFSVGGPSPRELTADSLWHLLLAEPELCERELVYLLEILKPDWQLAQTAHGIEQALCNMAELNRTSHDQVWLRLVEQLGSETFSERQAAERELRTRGKHALPFLAAVDPRPLDAEQQFRLRSIIHSMAGAGGMDTPKSVAAWMMADPRLWLALLSRSDEGRRRIAAHRLSELLGQPVDFDPAAATHVRQSQLRRLEERISAQTPLPARR